MSRSGGTDGAVIACKSIISRGVVRQNDVSKTTDVRRLATNFKIFIISREFGRRLQVERTRRTFSRFAMA
jgi:hypothetical protein